MASIGTNYSEIQVNTNISGLNGSNGNLDVNVDVNVGKDGSLDVKTTVDTNPNANSAAVYEPSKNTANTTNTTTAAAANKNSDTVTYKSDPAKVQAMLDEMEKNTNSLKALVTKMLENQVNKAATANAAVVSGGTDYKNFGQMVSNAAQNKNGDDNFGQLVSNAAKNKNGVTLNADGTATKADGTTINADGSMVTIDAATRAKAQQDISENGYYGVKAVTGRIMDFAQALSGGDPSKAELLRKAVQDGFKQAEQQWGGKLPQISQDTYNSVMSAFDNWESTGKIAQTTGVATESALLSNNAATTDSLGAVNPSTKSGM